MGLLYRLRRAIEEGPPWPPARLAEAGREGRIRRAAHRAAVARFPGGVRLPVLAVKAVAWPVWSLVRAVAFARYRGAGLPGILGIWATAMRYGVPPLEQYAYRIRPGAGAEAHVWMYHGEMMHLNRALADRAAVRLCADKVRLAAHLGASGLPVVATLAVIEPGATVRPEPEWGAIVAKPRISFAATGVEIWAPAEGDAVWERRNTPAERRDSNGLGERIASLAGQYGTILVQPLVTPHPRLARENAMIPPVLRVVSGQWPGGRVGIAYAVVWHQFDEAGADRPEGMAVVDLDDGALVASPAQREPVFPLMAQSSLARELEGPLPHWEAARAAVQAGHAALPGRIPVLSWDVLLSCTGPVLLEANVGCSLYFHQAVTGVPASRTILGDVFAEWLETSARCG